jgi:hypothetical protein
MQTGISKNQNAALGHMGSAKSNGFGLGEGGDFYHKTSYEERKFKYSTNCHTKH